MVPEPNLDKHVFCRVKEDRGNFEIDPNDVENTLDLVQNDIIMAGGLLRTSSRPTLLHLLLLPLCTLCASV
jgi:hypothetical protein